MTDINESEDMNFPTYFNEDGEPQEPYDWGGPDGDCTCSKHSRCLNCIERDGLVKAEAV